MTIDRSKISGTTNTIVNDAEFVTNVGVSQLAGGPVTGAGTERCAGAYDEAYNVLPTSCA